MIFCLSLESRTQRVILDDELHGDVIAVIEAKTWQEARSEALGKEEMDPFSYRAGWEWFKLR